MGELLADYTTLRLGGPADRLLTHHDPTTWPDIARQVQDKEPPPFILGGGSNTLADDQGHQGLVIVMATRGTRIRPLDHDRVDVQAQAGEPLSELVALTAAEGLSGIEYLGGIPGTVGAAPVQNTGAYGQQISDTLTSLTAYDWTLHRTTDLSLSQCGLRYRASAFKAEAGRWTILSVTLRLTRSARAAPITYQHLADALAVPLGTRPPLTEAAQGVVADRIERGLSLPPSGPDARQAGSVFLNPTITSQQAATVTAAGGPVHCGRDGSLSTSAGWLVEQAGYGPGARAAAGVYCSTRRTLTLTARRSATASAFHEALRTMAERVYAGTGVTLHAEPVRLGASVRAVN